MQQLEKLIRQLESYIPTHEQLNTAVSASGVGWHIEHSLITIQRIIRAVCSQTKVDLLLDSVS